MAFASTVTRQDENFMLGGKLIKWGTFTNTDGSTGGNIDTGLRQADTVLLQYSGASAVADKAVVNETLSADGSAVTIVTTADADGYWLALGR